MMLSMTETDYENWRDDLRCGGQEEYDTQYSAASLYEGRWLTLEDLSNEELVQQIEKEAKNMI